MKLIVKRINWGQCVLFSSYYDDNMCTNLSIVWLLCTCTDACKLQVKALQMSPHHRNVKIIQGSLCRQCRCPIWTSFHLAESRALLAGSVYQSFECIGAGWWAPLPFLWPRTFSPVFQSQFFHTLFLIFLTSLRGQYEVLALAECTTRVWLGLVVPEAGTGPQGGWSPVQRLSVRGTLAQFPLLRRLFASVTQKNRVETFSLAQFCH